MAHGQAFGGNNTSGPIDCAARLNAKGGSGRMDFESETLVTTPTIAIHPRSVGRDNAGPEGKDWRDDGASFTMNTSGAGSVMAPLAFKIRGGSPTDTGEQGSKTVGRAAGKGFLGSEDKAFTVGATQDQMLAVPVAVDLFNQTLTGETHVPLRTAGGHGAPACIAFKTGQSAQARSLGEAEEVTPALSSDAGGNTVPAVCYENRAIPINTMAALRPQGADENRQTFGIGEPGDPCPTLSKAHSHAVAQPVAFQQNTRDEVRLMGGDGQYAGALSAEPGMKQQNYIAQPVAVAAPALTASNDPSRSPQSSEVTQQVAAVHAASMAVRRLTPVECARLQGFPDHYLDILFRGKPATDGHKYKALGNSMCTKVMAWLGHRIDEAMQP